MRIELEEIRRYVEACDPARPLQWGDKRYVELDRGTPVRGSDGHSCIDALRKTILLRDETCQLFTGFPGTGKSTELRRLEAELIEDKTLPTRVIYVDFDQYVDRYVPPTITDVLRILAFCLDREAATAEGKDFAKEPGYAKRLFDFLAHTDADLARIGFSAYGASLMFELRNNPSFRDRAESVLRLRFQQFAEEAQSAMTDAIVRLRKANGNGSERIVVIADSLEKFTPLREDDRGPMEASVESLFVQHAPVLHYVPCHVIYTFPIWLRFRVVGLGSQYDRDPLILPMVKVRDREGAAWNGGIEKMKQIVGHRVDLKRIFGDHIDQTLLPLIEASGGYPRELLRMVRELLYQYEQFPIRAEDANRIVEKMAEEYARIVRSTDLPLLAKVDQTHSLPEADEKEVAAFGRMLERWLILAYRNGEEWYDLHPLVRRAPIVREHLSRVAAR